MCCRIAFSGIEYLHCFGSHNCVTMKSIFAFGGFEFVYVQNSSLLWKLDSAEKSYYKELFTRIHVTNAEKLKLMNMLYIACFLHIKFKFSSFIIVIRILFPLSWQDIYSKYDNHSSVLNAFVIVSSLIKL